MEKLELQKIANEVRKDIVTALHSAKAGHPGGSLSAADIYTYLYFEEMNIDPKVLLIHTVEIYAIFGTKFLQVHIVTTDEVLLYMQPHFCAEL